MIHPATRTNRGPLPAGDQGCQHHRERYRRHSRRGRADTVPPKSSKSSEKCSDESPTGASIPTRSFRSALLSRPASSPGKSPIWFCSTSRRTRWASRQRTVRLQRSSIGRRPFPPRRAGSSPPSPIIRRRSRSTSFRVRTEQAAYNTPLGKFQLTDIAPAPKGVPQIEVTFEIDVNGIVQVTALDQATGRRQNIVTRAGSGLTDTEVNRLREDAKTHQTDEKTEQVRDPCRGPAARPDRKHAKEFRRPREKAERRGEVPGKRRAGGCDTAQEWKPRGASGSFEQVGVDCRNIATGAVAGLGHSISRLARGECDWLA